MRRIRLNFILFRYLVKKKKLFESDYIFPFHLQSHSKKYVKTQIFFSYRESTIILNELIEWVKFSFTKIYLDIM